MYTCNSSAVAAMTDHWGFLTVSIALLRALSQGSEAESGGAGYLMSFSGTYMHTSTIYTYLRNTKKQKASSLGRKDIKVRSHNFIFI